MGGVWLQVVGMTERLNKITNAMMKARKERRQVWILDKLIAIWDAEAVKVFKV